VNEKKLERDEHTLKMRDLLEELKEKPPLKCMLQTKTMRMGGIASK